MNFDALETLVAGDVSRQTATIEKANRLAERKKEKEARLGAEPSLQTYNSPTLATLSGKDFYDADSPYDVANLTPDQNTNRLGNIDSSSKYYADAGESPNTFAIKDETPTNEDVQAYRRSILAKDNFAMGTTPVDKEIYDNYGDISDKNWKLYSKSMDKVYDEGLGGVLEFKGTLGKQGIYDRQIGQVYNPKAPTPEESLQQRLIETGNARMKSSGKLLPEYGTIDSTPIDKATPSLEEIKRTIDKVQQENGRGFLTQTGDFFEHLAAGAIGRNVDEADALTEFSGNMLARGAKLAGFDNASEWLDSMDLGTEEDKAAFVKGIVGQDDRYTEKHIKAISDAYDRMTKDVELTDLSTWGNLEIFDNIGTIAKNAIANTDMTGRSLGWVFGSGTSLAAKLIRKTSTGALKEFGDAVAKNEAKLASKVAAGKMTPKRAKAIASGKAKTLKKNMSAKDRSKLFMLENANAIGMAVSMNNDQLDHVIANTEDYEGTSFTSLGRAVLGTAANFAGAKLDIGMMNSMASGAKNAVSEVLAGMGKTTATKFVAGIASGTAKLGLAGLGEGGQEYTQTLIEEFNKVYGTDINDEAGNKIGEVGVVDALGADSRREASIAGFAGVGSSMHITGAAMAAQNIVPGYNAIKTPLGALADRGGQAIEDSAESTDVTTEDIENIVKEPLITPSTEETIGALKRDAINGSTELSTLLRNMSNTVAENSTKEVNEEALKEINNIRTLATEAGGFSKKDFNLLSGLEGVYSSNIADIEAKEILKANTVVDDTTLNSDDLTLKTNAKKVLYSSIEDGDIDIIDNIGAETLESLANDPELNEKTKETIEEAAKIKKIIGTDEVAAEKLFSDSGLPSIWNYYKDIKKLASEDNTKAIKNRVDKLHNFVGSQAAKVDTITELHNQYLDDSGRHNLGKFNTKVTSEMVGANIGETREVKLGSYIQNIKSGKDSEYTINATIQQDGTYVLTDSNRNVTYPAKVINTIGKLKRNIVREQGILNQFQSNIADIINKKEVTDKVMREVLFEEAEASGTVGTWLRDATVKGDSLTIGGTEYTIEGRFVSTAEDSKDLTIKLNNGKDIDIKTNEEDIVTATLDGKDITSSIEFGSTEEQSSQEPEGTTPGKGKLYKDPDGKFYVDLGNGTMYSHTEGVVPKPSSFGGFNAVNNINIEVGVDETTGVSTIIGTDGTKINTLDGTATVVTKDNLVELAPTGSEFTAGDKNYIKGKDGLVQLVNGKYETVDNVEGVLFKGKVAGFNEDSNTVDGISLEPETESTKQTIDYKDFGDVSGFIKYVIDNRDNISQINNIPDNMEAGITNPEGDNYNRFKGITTNFVKTEEKPSKPKEPVREPTKEFIKELDVLEKELSEAKEELVDREHTYSKLSNTLTNLQTAFRNTLTKIKKTKKDIKNIEELTRLLTRVKNTKNSIDNHIKNKTTDKINRITVAKVLASIKKMIAKLVGIREARDLERVAKAKEEYGVPEATDDEFGVLLRGELANVREELEVLKEERDKIKQEKEKLPKYLLRQIRLASTHVFEAKTDIRDANTKIKTLFARQASKVMTDREGSSKNDIINKKKVTRLEEKFTTRETDNVALFIENTDTLDYLSASNTDNDTSLKINDKLIKSIKNTYKTIQDRMFGTSGATVEFQNEANLIRAIFVRDFFNNSALKPDDIKMSMVATVHKVTYNYILSQGRSMESNNAKDIAAILGKKEEEVLLGEMALFAEGIPRTALVDSLGTEIYNEIGYKLKDTEPKETKYKLIVELGTVALAVLEGKRKAQKDTVLLDNKTNSFIESLDDTTIGKEQIEAFGLDVNDYKAFTGNESAKIAMVKLSDFGKDMLKKNDKGEVNPYVTSTLKELEKLGTNSFNVIESYEKLPKSKTANIKNTPVPQEGSDFVANHINRLQSEEYVVVDGVKKAVDILPKKDFLKLLGYKDTSGMDYSSKVSIEANNKSIERSYDNYLDLLKRSEENDNKPFYFKWFFGQNHRYYLDSNGVNPQSGVFHRFAVGLKKNLSVVNDANRDIYYKAVAQAFGYDIDKEAKAVEEGKEIVKLVKASDMGTILNTLVRDGEWEGYEPEHISHTMQAIDSIDSYKENMSFNTTLTIEIDAITSGIILKLMQMPLNSGVLNLLVKGGFITKEGLEGNTISVPLKDVKGTNDLIAKGLEDLYKTMARTSEASVIEGTNRELNNLGAKIASKMASVKTKKGLRFDSVKIGENDKIPLNEHIANNQARVIVPKLLKYVPKMTENGQVTKAARLLFKPVVMVFGYGASLRRTIQSFSSNIVENIPKDILSKDTEKSDKAYNLFMSLIKNLDEPYVLKEEGKIKFDSNRKLISGAMIDSDTSKQELVDIVKRGRSDILSVPSYSYVLVEENEGIEGKVVYGTFTARDAAMSAVEAVYGEAVESTLKGLFPGMIEANNIINSAFLEMYNLYKTKYDGALKSIGKTNLTVSEAEEAKIFDKINKFLPSITSMTDTKVQVLGKEKAYSESHSTNLVSSKNTTKNTSQSTVSLAKVFMDAARSGSVLPIHALDAYIQATVNNTTNALGVHDANVFSMKQAMEGNLLYNDTTFKASSSYSVVEEVSKQLDGVIMNSKDISPEVLEVKSRLDNLKATTTHNRLVLFSKESITDHATGLGATIHNESKPTDKKFIKFNDSEVIMTKEEVLESIDKLAESTRSAIKSKLKSVLDNMKEC